MRRSAAVVAGLFALLISGRSAAGEARVVDMVLGEVGTTPVTLSEVALARSLGVLGLVPTTGPITDAELTRYLDAQLAVREAIQLAIDVPAADIDRAWESAGGAALGARLDAVGVDRAWARRLLETNLRVERFLDLRFRDFAFVTDLDVDEALGAGQHDEAERSSARERLRSEIVARAFSTWQEDARQRVPIRRVTGVTGPWPAPFSLDLRARAK